MTGVVFLITGASQGLGRAIATVASRYCTSPRFVLVARSEEGLEQTKGEILSHHHLPNQEDPQIPVVVCRSMDLSDLDQLETHMDLLLEDVDRLSKTNVGGPNNNNKIVFVNNAGSLGHLGPSWTSPSLKDMRHTVDLNVTSSLWLSVRFARYIRQQQHWGTLVNLSSLVAISDDFVSMGIYSAGKAAREKYHTLLAKEAASSRLKVLNYAPGPLETNMVRDIRAAENLDTNLKAQFEALSALDPKESAQKLIRLLEDPYEEWETGAHIDFYDLPDCKD